MTFDGAAAGYIDERLARRYAAAPIRFLDDTTLLVAMADPQNLQALEDLRLITGFDVQPAIASEEDVFGAIAKIYRERAEVGQNLDELGRAAVEEDSIKDIRDATEEAPIVKLVNSVIAQSVDDAASDIHFEPQAKELARALPHRRRAARDHVRAAAHAERRHQPPEDHGRPGHRRAPRAAGRAHRPGGGRQAHRHARRHAAHGVRREDRHAPAGQVQRHAGPGGPGLRREGAQALPQAASPGPTAPSWSPARPAPASPPPCTRL